MLSAVNIQNGQIEFDEYRLISEEEFDREHRRTQIEAGDVLLTIVGTIGRAAVVPACSPEFTLQRSVAVLKPTEIGPRFVKYQLQSPTTNSYLNENAKGTAQKGIYLRSLGATPFLVPPADEQKRIVEKIDTLFAELDKGEESLRQVQTLLARYRQSVLKAAVTGELTADWRAERAGKLEHGRDLLERILHTRRETWEGRGSYKDPSEPDAEFTFDLPSEWAWASLSQLCFVKGGVTVDRKREPEDPVTVPYLRVANVQNGYLDLGEIKQITVDRVKADQCLLAPGDILLNEGGDRDKLGRGWVWDGEIDPCIHQNHVFRARPVLSDLSAKFISYYANAFGQPFFMARGKQSVNLASISLTAISTLPVPLPPPPEQEEIVRAIEEKIAAMSEVVEACEHGLKRSAALRQSILKDAFSGRLVPQDPNDEPASELLARIRQSREAGQDRSRRRKSATGA